MPDVVLISNGMSAESDFKLIVRNINAKIAGVVPLGNVPNNGGKYLALTGLWIANVVGVSITTPPALSIGSDNPTYSNIAAIVALTGLTQGNMAPIPFRAQYPFLAPNTAVALNITTAGIAAGNISLTALIKGEWV